MILDGRCYCNIPKWKYCSIGKYLPSWDSNKIHDFARNAQKCPNAQGNLFQREISIRLKMFRLPSRRLLSKATSGRLVAAVVVDAAEAEAVAWAAHLAGSKSTYCVEILKSILI